ncbi:MAG: hypothetical protein RBT37_06540 [Dissulfurispiraceae bacterium]|nr:hypothetical protein [Dissulfurispiraceae bacterium]
MDIMIKRISIQSLIAVSIAAVAALIFADIIFAFSIILSGTLGLLNFRGIVWGAKGLVGSEKPQFKMVVLTTFRMLIMFSLLLVFFILKILNLFGVLAGFTIVFVIIVKEGLMASRKKTALSGTEKPLS